MPRYTVEKQFTHRGQPVKPNDVIEVTTGEAKHLIAGGLIACKPVPPPAATDTENDKPKRGKSTHKKS